MAKVEVLSNCDLSYEVIIGDNRQTLTYAEITHLHAAIEVCLEWDKPHVEPTAEEFAAQLDEMLEQGK